MSPPARVARRGWQAILAHWVGAWRSDVLAPTSSPRRARRGPGLASVSRRPIWRGWLCSAPCASIAFVWLAWTFLPSAMAATPALTVRDDLGRLSLTWISPLDPSGHGGVKFEEEAENGAYADRINGRSLEGAAQVDCRALTFQLQRFTVHTLPKLQGQAVLAIGERTEWRSADPGTTMARVVRAACGGPSNPKIRRPAPLDPTAVRGSDPLVGPTTSSPLRRPDELTDGPQGGGQGAPELAVTQHGLIRAVLSAAEVADKTPSTPAPKAPETAMVGPSGDYFVQLFALPSGALADHAWRTLRDAQPALLGHVSERVETKVVNGARYYRVLVGGFATQREAHDLCERLSRAGSLCWVRRAS